MNGTDFIAHLGDEYPAAIMIAGARYVLIKERRFSRIYRSEEDSKSEAMISRFMDDSASITSAELKREWTEWDDRTRRSFCMACAWIKQTDFPEMLRYIMQYGSQDHCSAIAMNVALHLPMDEAFQVLLEALRKVESSDSPVNFTQGIACTKHPDAGKVLREHLEKVWADPKLWEDDSFYNLVAFDAITCIAHLIDWGATAAEFSSQARQLSKHVCKGNRESWAHFLAKHYPGLGD